MDDFQIFLDEQLGKVKISSDMDEENYVEYDIYAEVSKMVSGARQENKMTQKELAHKTGLTQANISNIEKGSAKPTIETLKKIADAVGKRLVIEFTEREVM